jgi:hypothetical protein
MRGARRLVLISLGGLVATGVLLFLVVLLLRAWWSLPLPVFGAGGGPTQPIAFSHQRHVQEVGIDCTFCHRNITQGAAATIPAVQQCMFCHRVIGTGNPEVEKLRTYWEEQQPINWERVHRVPDHVHFVHEAHVRYFTQGDTPDRQLAVAQVCTICHGQVQTMTKVKQVRSLKMGDCVSCHRQYSAPTDCTTCHY